MSDPWMPKHKWLGSLGDWAGRLEKVFSRNEDLEKKLARYRRLLELHVRRSGSDSRPATNCRVSIAQTLEALERMDEAAETRRATYAACKRHLGESHPSTINEAMYLAHDLYVSGHQDEARLLAQTARADGERFLGTKHELTDWADEFLASTKPPPAGPVTQFSSSAGRHDGGSSASSASNTARITQKTEPWGDDSTVDPEK